MSIVIPGKMPKDGKVLLIDPWGNALVLIEATLDRRLAPLEGLMEELCKAWRADE